MNTWSYAQTTEQPSPDNMSESHTYIKKPGIDLINNL